MSEADGGSHRHLVAAVAAAVPHHTAEGHAAQTACIGKTATQSLI